MKMHATPLAIPVRRISLLKLSEYAEFPAAMPKFLCSAEFAELLKILPLSQQAQKNKFSKQQAYHKDWNYKKKCMERSCAAVPLGFGSRI